MKDTTVIEMTEDWEARLLAKKLRNQGVNAKARKGIVILPDAKPWQAKLYLAKWNNNEI